MVLDEIAEGVDHPAVVPAGAGGVPLGERDDGTPLGTVDFHVQALLQALALEGVVGDLHEATSPLLDGSRTH